jgi:hypothetical protein
VASLLQRRSPSRGLSASLAGGRARGGRGTVGRRRTGRAQRESWPFLFLPRALTLTLGMQSAGYAGLGLQGTRGLEDYRVRWLWRCRVRGPGTAGYASSRGAGYAGSGGAGYAVSGTIGYASSRGAGYASSRGAGYAVSGTTGVRGLWRYRVRGGLGPKGGGDYCTKGPRTRW